MFVLTMNNLVLRSRLLLTRALHAPDGKQRGLGGGVHVHVAGRETFISQCSKVHFSAFITSQTKLWLEPSDMTEAPPAPVKPDSELIQEVVLPVDRMLVTPLRSMSPVLRCFFSLRPCEREIGKISGIWRVNH